MKHYNPDIDPDADQWLALDEAGRIDLVEKYHRREETQPPSPTAHDRSEAGRWTAVGATDTDLRG